MSIVSAKGLTKYYGTLRAIHGINFEISEGEFFGFLGPNGAGKTTAMCIIYCFFPPTSGSLDVFGMDVNNRPGEIKARTGVMPQDDNLDLELSVFENLMVYARYFDIPRREASARAEKLLNFVELTEKSDINIRALSGGMKRKLMLARSLLNKPDLLMLDEPTTGLDPHSRHSVWENLNHLKSKNTTLILTTHYMEEAEKLCDRVAIMNSGNIVTIDTPDNLMNIHGGNLEEVYLKLTGASLTY
jgi:lipooligosaccharide transport system ATP-binding protein